MHDLSGLTLGDYKGVTRQASRRKLPSPHQPRCTGSALKSLKSRSQGLRLPWLATLSYISTFLTQEPPFRGLPQVLLPRPPYWGVGVTSRHFPHSDSVHSTFLLLALPPPVSTTLLHKTTGALFRLLRQWDNPLRTHWYIWRRPGGSPRGKMDPWGASAFSYLASCFTITVSDERLDSYFHFGLLPSWTTPTPGSIAFSSSAQLLTPWPSITTPHHPCCCPKGLPAAVRGTLCFWGAFSSGLGSRVLMLRQKGISEALSSEADIWLWLWLSCPGKETCNKGLLRLLVGATNYLSDQERPNAPRLFSFLSREKMVIMSQ